VRLAKHSTMLIAILVFCILSITVASQSIFITENEQVHSGLTILPAIIVPDNFTSIQEAINNATEGDAIFVRNGTYYENINVNKTVLLVGANRNTTIIDGNNITAVIVSANNVLVANLTIRNSQDYTMAGVRLNGGFGTIQNNVFLNNYHGIMVCSNSNIVTSNYFSDNYLGVSLVWCSNNVITGNKMHDSKNGGAAISGGFMSNNLFSCNDIVNNYDGLSVGGESSNNVFIGNNIESNDRAGINLYGSDNTFVRNNISNNWVGISFQMMNGIGSSNNTIFHNSIINNSNYQVYIWYYTVNSWDDGYPSGGNYWSDYTGVDLYSGPSQNETGSDGIGDTPYSIYASNRDNYPLTKPYAGLHDLGVVNITTSKTGCLPTPTVCRGYNLTISVKILNYGVKAETFNLTIYANSTSIHSITEVVLDARNSSTITSTWNTIGFVYGNYTIEAIVGTVLDETDVNDNALIDGWVVVTMPGDVNGDFRCEGKDNAAVAKAYDTDPSKPLWNPNADINGDRRVEGKDNAIVAKYYGTQYP